MTTQELYEKMRVTARQDSNSWDDLDFCTGFDDNASDADGEFFLWSELSENTRAIFSQRSQPWLSRYEAGAQ
jgi:hypothetical protein